MNDMTIGVLGGMGTYATIHLFRQYAMVFPVPEKVPMPRPVDYYFDNWDGPKRPEFRDDIDINQYTGNQKWQMWCLERFLDMIEQ